MIVELYSMLGTVNSHRYTGYVSLTRCTHDVSRIHLYFCVGHLVISYEECSYVSNLSIHP